MSGQYAITSASANARPKAPAAPKPARAPRAGGSLRARRRPRARQIPNAGSSRVLRQRARCQVDSRDVRPIRREMKFKVAALAHTRRPTRSNTCARPRVRYGHPRPTRMRPRIFRGRSSVASLRWWTHVGMILVVHLKIEGYLLRTVARMFVGSDFLWIDLRRRFRSAIGDGLNHEVEEFVMG